ncbi:MAG: phage shock protein A [Arenicella sp.]|jgi:phage shock protein A
MSILKNLMTALRGNVSSAGEAMIDHQAITILEQEIRDGKSSIAKSYVSIRNLKAQAIKLQEQVNDIDEDIAGYTTKAKQLVSEEKMDLAQKTAQRVADLTNQRVGVKENADKLTGQVDMLLSKVKAFETQLQQDQIDLEQLKTFEAVHKVQQQVISSTPSVNSDRKRIERAKSRVKQRQENVEAKMAADDWMREATKADDLDSQLAAAGIGETGTSADDILASLTKS